MNIHERLFIKLEFLGVIPLIEQGREAATSKGEPFMDLHYNYLYADHGRDVISLAHYFKQNGDLCCDPDMEIRIDMEHQTAEALSFQQAIPPIYQMVYPEPGKVDLNRKRELNGFLMHWLGNCELQGHHFEQEAA